MYYLPYWYSVIFSDIVLFPAKCPPSKAHSFRILKRWRMLGRQMFLHQKQPLIKVSFVLNGIFSHFQWYCIFSCKKPSTKSRGLWLTFDWFRPSKCNFPLPIIHTYVHLLQSLWFSAWRKFITLLIDHQW